MKHTLTFFALSFLTLFTLQTASADVLPLKADGETLAEYKFTEVPFKPYIQTLFTPAGRNILRDAPWDHLHHHALMFAIYVGDVNFWEEHNDRAGKQITDSAEISPDGVLRSELSWQDGDGKTLAKESREISVESRDDATVLVWKTALTPAGDEAVKFGTGTGAGHYHGMGMRFDESMDADGFFRMDIDVSGESIADNEIITSCGWVAYTTKLDGKPVTIAVYDMPGNTRPMAAFTMGKDCHFSYLSACMNLHKEAITLEPGETLRANYRVVVWEGEATVEMIEAFQ